MKVIVLGGTGVIGRAAVRALVAAGHEVEVVCRSVANIELVESLGARARLADVFEVDAMTEAFTGADAVVNLTSNIPVGYAAILPSSWKRNDDLRVRGAATVVAASRVAGVRRVVQGSTSCLYADHGDRWIDESAPLDITPVTEPIAVAESHVQGYAGGFRTGVVLRFGNIVGDDPQTRFWLKAAANGRPVGVGRSDQWTHLVHTDDLGDAVVASLRAASGTYNVGAAPVPRGEMVDGYAKAAGAPGGAFLGPLLRRLAGPRLEPLARSLRVNSDRFTAATGWSPQRPTFDPAWLEAADTRPHAVR